MIKIWRLYELILNLMFYGHIAQFTSRDISLYYMGANSLFT